ncbi:MoaF C-terminal domain-containing protein [Erwinia persicina]|uniref:MoaF C-terminal domain-containing protein n=1 Tax=Erwinia persicina TaxID=55211 RepID=UPI0017874D9B|nr:MoaF C-terminal domain-containing protein [Erwinia persicina]MBD8168116.1 MoaF N-terminal domain-containing protein [Erwinia persicina]
MSHDVTYIPVGALAECFAPQGNILPMRPPLQTVLTLYFSSDEAIICQFNPDGTLRWGNQSAIAYRLTSLREGIEFIDFIDNSRSAATLTLVCDHHCGRFTLVCGQLPTPQQAHLSALHRIKLGLPLTGVQAAVRFGWFNGGSSTHAGHTFSDELTGMRNQYRYSPTECYEHIYLNADCYAWHCLQGGEQGLADVDRCQTVKIDDRLYLLIWQEKVVPTLGVVLIDLQAARTDGKIFGYQQDDFKRLSNFAMGAALKVINITPHAAQ